MVLSRKKSTWSNQKALKRGTAIGCGTSSSLCMASSKLAMCGMKSFILSWSQWDSSAVLSNIAYGFTCEMESGSRMICATTSNCGNSALLLSSLVWRSSEIAVSAPCLSTSGSTSWTFWDASICRIATQLQHPCWLDPEFCPATEQDKEEMKGVPYLQAVGTWNKFSYFTPKQPSLICWLLQSVNWAGNNHQITKIIGAKITKVFSQLFLLEITKIIGHEITIPK